MIDHVIVRVAHIHLGGVYAVGFLHRLDLLDRPRQPHEPRVELLHISLDGLHIVAFRVNGNKNWLDLRRGLFVQQAHNLRHFLQLGRAHIRAIGKTEKDQLVFAGKILLRHGLSVLIDQRERPAQIHPRHRGVGR